RALERDLRMEQLEQDAHGHGRRANGRLGEPDDHWEVDAEPDDDLVEAPLRHPKLPRLRYQYGRRQLSAGDDRQLLGEGRMLVPVERSGLDDDKLSMLAKWAAGLRDDQRAEVAAAGRAIEMLIDEVERLNVLIWERRLDTGGEAGLAQIWQGAEAPGGEDASPTLGDR